MTSRPSDSGLFALPGWWEQKAPENWRSNRGDAGMNIDILEEYIKQEWAPDFHYARYDTIPWTPFQKAANTACIALVTTAGVHLRQDPPFAGIDDASYREIPETALARD